MGSRLIKRLAPEVRGLNVETHVSLLVVQPGVGPQQSSQRC